MKETSLHAINLLKRIEEILLKSFLKSHPLWVTLYVKLLRIKRTVLGISNCENIK